MRTEATANFYSIAEMRNGVVFINDGLFSASRREGIAISRSDAHPQLIGQVRHAHRTLALLTVHRVRVYR